MIDEFRNTVKRKVWEDNRGTRLLTVTGLLPVGEYKIEKEKREDGSIEMIFYPVD